MAVTTRSLAIGSACVALLGAGCTAKPICEELEKCGGDLEGTWVNDAACLDDTVRGQPPSSLRSQPTTPAGEVPPEPSSTDWCSGLVFENDGVVRRVVPWRPLLPIGRATLTYTRGDAPFAEGRYDFAVLYSGQVVIELSTRCLTEHAIDLSCAELGPALEVSQQVDADITNFQCVDRSEGGCRCTYDVQSFGGGSGVWDSADGRVHTFDDNRAPLGRADYCVQGNQLQLSGDSLTYLFNEASVRTMTFHRQ